MDCGCAAPFLGPSLANTCSGNAFVMFMSLLDNVLRKNCDVSEVCDRIVPKSVPDADYDFIVIGGGSAGSVVAARLAEVPTWKVLLIEAGDDEPVGTQVPSMFENFVGNPTSDWNYKTEPENFACQGYPEKKCNLPTGKVLGGYSSLNGMLYLRGTPKDYDDWAAEGCTGWCYNEIKPFFLMSEDNTEIGTLVERKYHSMGGPLTTQRFNHKPELVDDILEAAKELNLPISNDLNGYDFTGFNVVQTNSRDGVRLSSAKAFLRPSRFKPNLHIMLNSTVAKIIINVYDTKKLAQGVEFIYNNQTFTVRSKTEIILTAGAINSPKILLLSGVGPKEELHKVGVPLVHNLPGVGKNLNNHVSFYNTYLLKKINSSNPLDWLSVLKYFAHKSGPLASTGMTQLTARLNTKYSSKKDPDLQYYFTGFEANCASTGEVGALRNPEKPDEPHRLLVSSVNLKPKSKGYIELRSNSPLDPPIIVANFLKESSDLMVLIEGIRLMQKMANTTILMEKYGMELMREDYGDCVVKFEYDSDDFWKCAIKYYTGSESNQACTCKMGPSTDRMAVVDSTLQLHGVEGLRIMDASVFPKLVSGNAYTTSVMIAEKGAHLIKEKWLYPFYLSESTELPYQDLFLYDTYLTTTAF